MPGVVDWVGGGGGYRWGGVDIEGKDGSGKGGDATC